MHEAAAGSTGALGRTTMTIGYTTGIFDVLGSADLDLVRRARERCDHLMIGVADDALAERLLGRPPLLPVVERIAIVAALRWVELVVPQPTDDMYAAWRSLRFDVLFGLHSRRREPMWAAAEADLGLVGVAVVYLPDEGSPDPALLWQGRGHPVAD